MSHGEIRKAIRELEDQQRADSVRHSQLIGTVVNTVELNRRTRQKNVTGLTEQNTDLCDRVHGLEYKQKSFVAELKAAYSNRHDAEAALRERIVKLEEENAELRKGQAANCDAIADIRFQFNALKKPFEHRVSLQDQVDWLKTNIAELEKQEEERCELDDLFRAQIDKMRDTLPPGDKPNVPDIEAAQAAHDKGELDRLVDYIRSELPDGTAEMGENVTDTAIRLLKRYRAALQDIMKTEIADGLLREPSMAVTTYRIAWDALNASLEQGDDAI